MTNEMAAFLRDCLDEYAELAMAATPGPWRHDEAKHWRKPGTSWFEEAVFAGPTGEEATCVAGTGETDDQQSMRDAAHIARHNPARVLREIEAKRRMIEAFERTSHGERTAPHEDMRNVSGAKVDTWRFALRLLALSYTDHPDYREEWRP